MPEPKSTKPPLSAIERRLAKLVASARGLDLWERLWRGSIPPLVVVGVFLAVSWLGVWLAVPHWARAAGLVFFAVALGASSFGLWRLRPLSRADALRRVDRASGAVHRPASALDDRLSAAGRDPGTDALWALHRRRAEAEAARLTAGRPSPRAVELDRYALRLGVVVALFACAIIAIAVMIERFISINKASADNESLSEQVREHLMAGRVNDALAVCEQHPGPVAGLLANGIRNRNMDADSIERAMEELALRETPLLYRRLGVLDTIITIAPLLGLLGTVTGMIKSFNVVGSAQGLNNILANLRGAEGIRGEVAANRA